MENYPQSCEDSKTLVSTTNSTLVSFPIDQNTDHTISLQEGSPSPQKIAFGKIGKYQLLDFLGMGGAGIVYSAKDESGAYVAIKIMIVTPLMTKTEINRFLSEAETSKRLRKHPNIITVYDTGHDGQNYYIVMELVSGGKTLNDMLRKKLTINQVLSYMIPVAKALAYAHEEGILHRDLKPANILINEFNQPLLADFGLAKSETADRMTMTGTIMGTPRYMSPEQCGFGDSTTTRQSDLYSLGLILYELLTGTLPYQISSDMPLPEMFKTICTQEAKPPRKLRKDISRNLEAVVLRMLEKEKKLRYKEISQVCSDLEACLDGKAVSVRHLSLAERWEKWLRKHASQAIIVAIALSTGIIFYYGFLLPRDMEKACAKQKADVSALAAKRKAILLENELETLKNPQLHKGAEDTEGMRLLSQARIFMATNRFDEAESQFVSAKKWALENGHNGILIESCNSLARIAMGKKENAKAFGIFQEVANSCGKKTLTAQLAVLESGIAQLLDSNRDGAILTWTELIHSLDKDKNNNIDSANSVTYIIKEIAEMMIGRMDIAKMEDKVASFPPFFKGLGYWILAQNTADQGRKNEYLAEAERKKGIFVWINNKEQK